MELAVRYGWQNSNLIQTFSVYGTSIKEIYTGYKPKQCLSPGGKITELLNFLLLQYAFFWVGF